MKGVANKIGNRRLMRVPFGTMVLVQIKAAVHMKDDKAVWRCVMSSEIPSVLKELDTHEHSIFCPSKAHLFLTKSLWISLFCLHKCNIGITQLLSNLCCVTEAQMGVKAPRGKHSSWCPWKSTVPLMMEALQHPHTCVARMFRILISGNCQHDTVTS